MPAELRRGDTGAEHADRADQPVDQVALLECRRSRGHRPLVLIAQTAGSAAGSLVATSPCATGATSDRELRIVMPVRAVDGFVGGSPQNRRMGPRFGHLVGRGVRSLT